MVAQLFTWIWKCTHGFSKFQSSYITTRSLLDEDMKFLGEPEQVHMRNMDEQLHAHDCYRNVIATSGYRISCKVYIQLHSTKTVGSASWSSPTGMPQMAYTLQHTGLAHHVLSCMMYNKSFLSEKISGHYYFEWASMDRDRTPKM